MNLRGICPSHTVFFNVLWHWHHAIFILHKSWSHSYCKFIIHSYLPSFILPAISESHYKDLLIADGWEYWMIYMYRGTGFFAPTPPPHLPSLKGHGNEVDFLGFLQKLVPHRSLILPFEPFSFWRRIRGDIHNRKTTPRLGESVTLRLGFWMF